MRTILSIVAILGVLPATQSTSLGDDAQLRAIAAALKKWQEAAPVPTGHRTCRYFKGKYSLIEKDWYWDGRFKYAKTRAQKTDGAVAEYVLFDNGSYFASVSKSKATLGKWGLRSLVLSTDSAYASNMSVEKAESWPGAIGVGDVVGATGPYGIVGKLTTAPIESGEIQSVTSPEGLECRLVHVRFDQSKKWHGVPPPLSLKLLLAKDYDWLPIKTVETTADGLIDTWFIDGWRKVQGKWMWTTRRGYNYTEERDEGKLVTEERMTEGGPPEEFDTKQCFLAYYGIAEPKISRWPSVTFALMVLVPVLIAGGVWWFYAKRWRAA